MTNFTILTEMTKMPHGWNSIVSLGRDFDVDGCSTGAILCCPSCFTTICYTGKPFVCSFVITVRMHRRSDPHGIVFMSDEVSNCLELLDSAMEVNIKGEDGKLRKVSSYKLICDVCENEVGFKREGKYYITGAIEENASICFVC